MGQYGKAAVLATQCYVQGKFPSVREAWAFAISKFSERDSVRGKACPRRAYLGLCEAGRVSGIRAGNYGPKPNVNGQYAVDACQLLQSDPKLLTDKKALWDRIEKRDAKNEQGQLDVVVTMWSAGLLH